MYPTKTPITAAELLNHRVLPMFEEHGMSVLRMLTDRGTEYSGRVESHDYELYLAVNKIEYTKTKAFRLELMGFVNDFIKGYCMSFIMSHFEKRFMKFLTNCKKIWMIGCNITITNELTKKNVLW